ncbi:Golgin candidate 5 [Trichoplax sp. H2]|nr:Golgin candidate 5 [Trichoplax sp. H2]|eukprot:RDD39996.1 Golgin candidate 5 [Trichoplax sp. H2]
MSWFSTSSLDFAKSAFVKAQQQIDRVLDIQDEDSTGNVKSSSSGHQSSKIIGHDVRHDRKSQHQTNKTSKPTLTPSTSSSKIALDPSDINKQRLGDDNSLWDTYLNEGTDDSAPSTPLHKLVAKPATISNKSPTSSGQKPSTGKPTISKEKKEASKRGGVKAQGQRTITSPTKRPTKTGHQLTHKRNHSSSSIDGKDSDSAQPLANKQVDETTEIEAIAITESVQESLQQKDQPPIDHSLLPLDTTAQPFDHSHKVDHPFDHSQKVQESVVHHPTNLQSLQSDTDDDKIEPSQGNIASIESINTNVNEMKQVHLDTEERALSSLPDQQFHIQDSNELLPPTTSDTTTENDKVDQSHSSHCSQEKNTIEHHSDDDHQMDDASNDTHELESDIGQYSNQQDASELNQSSGSSTLSQPTNSKLTQSLSQGDNQSNDSAESCKVNHNVDVSEISQQETIPQITENSQSPIPLEKYVEKVEKLQKQLDHYYQLIEARETKIVVLSKTNHDLDEANVILRRQLEQAEIMRKADDDEVEKLTREFTNRISTSEGKLKDVIRDRDLFKKKVAELEEVLATQLESHSTILEEKENEVRELRNEGERLSKQQLQSNNIIKKLRAKEKESDSALISSRENVATLQSECEKLRESLKQKDQKEAKLQEQYDTLNEMISRQEKKSISQKQELDNALEKARSLQSALDKSYVELAELHKESAHKQSQAKEIALSAEVLAKEELRMTIDREKRKATEEQERLAMQIKDLQSAISRSEQQTTWTEETLRREISDMQMRLQAAESRNQDLSQSISQATQPLLRQINNLQNSHKSQLASWEAVERNLTERLNETNQQLMLASEKEQVATTTSMESISKLANYEAQIKAQKKQITTLKSELQAEKLRYQDLDDNMKRQKSKADEVKASLFRDLRNLRNDKDLSETQMQNEISNLEQELKKTTELLNISQEKLKFREHSRTDSWSSSTGNANAISDVPASSSLTQSELLEQSLRSHSVASTPTAGGEFFRRATPSTIMEVLQAQLKQKEGEVSILQEEVSTLKQSRSSIAEDVLHLNMEIESLQDEAEAVNEWKASYKELQTRYNAMLQMYGEKAEEAQELRLDLEDVKMMYRTQIDQLLKQSK